MAHRIVKEYIAGGRERFVVQTNRGWFGLKKLLDIWTIETIKYNMDDFDAIFNSLEEAEEFCNDIYLYSYDTVLSTEVIKVYDD